jgi:Recombination endonuclease VII
MIKRPNEKCAICGSTPKKRSLHRDHDHAWKKVKIKIPKRPRGWIGYVATAFYNGKEFVTSGDTKTQVRQEMNEILLAASQRGVLCFNCNTGLKRFFDKPERLRAAADYLEAFSGKKSNS